MGAIATNTNIRHTKIIRSHTHTNIRTYVHTYTLTLTHPHSSPPLSLVHDVHGNGHHGVG